MASVSLTDLFVFESLPYYLFQTQINKLYHRPILTLCGSVKIAFGSAGE